MGFEGYWRPFRRTERGHPQLSWNEKELLIVPKVSIYFGDTKVHRLGVCTLTTHRILWVDDDVQPKLLLAFDLRYVKDVTTKAGFIGVSSPKVTLDLLPRPAEEKEPSSAPIPPPAPGYIRLSFADHGRDEFCDLLKDAIRGKAWEVPEKNSPDAKLQSADFSTSRAGIGGIIRAVKDSQRETDKAVDEAFSDLKTLMNSAHDMVQLATRFAAQKQTHEREAKGSDDQEEEARQFDSLLVNMGIPNPVTKRSAGDSYHTQLARQLADFLRPLIQREGGVMVLTDVYSMYNRARGTELVSPEDLLHACETMSILGIGMRLRKFDSGVMVIQDDSLTDRALADRIFAVMLKREEPPVSPSHARRPLPTTSISSLELSEALRISLVLARQHLISAEAQGFLCRDQSPEGLRFHVNFFAEFQC